MSAGSKLTLAVIVLFGVLLGVYYGFGGPGVGAPRIGNPPPATNVAVGDLEGLPAVSKPVASPTIRSVQPALTPQWGPASAQSVKPKPESTDSPGIRVLSFQETPRRSRSSGPSDAGNAFYTVRSDDSMWTIAQKWLGSGARWQEIARLNPGIDADRLDVGMKLRMPSKSVPKAAGKQAPVPERASSDQKIHTVAEGDSLASIASRYLGSSARWESIYKANRSVLGNDPHSLKIGMKLAIPG